MQLKTCFLCSVHKMYLHALVLCLQYLLMYFSFYFFFSFQWKKNYSTTKNISLERGSVLFEKKNSFWADCIKARHLWSLQGPSIKLTFINMLYSAHIMILDIHLLSDFHIFPSKIKISLQLPSIFSC